MFNFFKKDKTSLSRPQVQQPNSVLPPEPEFDYDPLVYSKNYPRDYEMTSYSILEDGLVFYHDIDDYLLRTDVKRVIFTDAPIPEGYKLVDLSLYQDRSIMAWNQTLGNEMCLVISTGEKGKGIQLNPVSSQMFYCFDSLRSVEWNGVVDGSILEATPRMFMGCVNLQSVDLSNLNIHQIKNMRQMFTSCERLKNVTWFDLSTTGDAFSTAYMFSSCYSIESIDMRDFDARSLQDCSGMFFDCRSLRAVNLGKFKVANEDKLNFERMFCKDGMLSLLCTDNETIQTDFMNPDEETRYRLTYDHKIVTRDIVEPQDWFIPVYEWERPASPASNISKSHSEDISR